MKRNQRTRTLVLLGVVGTAVGLGGCGTTFAYSTHERHYGYGSSRYCGPNWGRDWHGGGYGGRHRDRHGGGGHHGGHHGGGPRH